MQAKLYKLRPLGKQTHKKIVTGYMNEGFEFWRHLFAKSVRYKIRLMKGPRTDNF